MFRGATKIKEKKVQEDDTRCTSPVPITHSFLPMGERMTYLLDEFGKGN